MLARHIIYQLIEDHAHDIESLEIIALFHRSIDQIDAVLDPKLLYPKSRMIDIEKLRKIFIPIKFELSSKNLGLSKKSIAFLMGLDLDHFLHVAASSDFRKTGRVEKKMMQANALGTENVLKLCKKLKIKNLYYTSSAFVCGKKYGFISSDDNDPAEFNNYYEQTKFMGESYVKEYCMANNINYCVFRISAIAGRLFQEPIGYTTKYDLFYAWAHFFYKMRERMGLIFDQTLILKI
jgi:nucleoside-diphosphate-sugar epimerase